MRGAGASLGSALTMSDGVTVGLPWLMTARPAMTRFVLPSRMSVAPLASSSIGVGVTSLSNPVTIGVPGFCFARSSV
jgi:hypothetical protein